jgi:protein-disulfide isomerase
MKKLLAVAALAMLVSPYAMAEEGFTAAQKTEIEAVARQLLIEKEPEIIMKAIEVLKQREQTQQLAIGKEAVNKNKERIYNEPTSPVLGNPKGDVTIVEFYDYACGYCKMAQPTIKALLEQDKNVRFIAKEFPILGEGSILASRAAIASIKQNKFEKFHDVLMSFHGAMNEASIMDAAQRSGLDTAKLKRDMNDKSVDETIAINRKLGNDLGVRGTPMFIIGDVVNPGALDEAALKQAVINARNAKK